MHVALVNPSTVGIFKEQTDQATALADLNVEDLPRKYTPGVWDNRFRTSDSVTVQSDLCTVMTFFFVTRGRGVNKLSLTHGRMLKITRGA